MQPSSQFDRHDHIPDDSAQVAREELAALPEPFRSALDLCYLRGLSHEEAAAMLGWPLGTLKTRLVRGRRQLRERLDRRGVGLGLALLLLLVLRPSPATADEAVPEALLQATVEAMARAASARAAAPTRTRASRARGGLAGRLATGWLAVAVVLLAGALAASLAARSEARAQTAQRDASLPASLTDVLNVDCR